MLDDAAVAALVSDAKNAEFSDPRLRARLANLTAKLAASPSESFPKILSSAELEGGYRFFGNHVVTPDGILSGHFDSVCAASRREPTALVVHDTSTFAFDADGARKGLGRLRSEGQAFFAHVSLVLSDDGQRRPLGLAALTTWVRGEGPSHGEKARWWNGVQRSSEHLDGARNVVHLMDREGDDYALLERLVEGKHRFIVRLNHDRLLSKSGPNSPRKLSEAMLQVECLVQREARLSKRTDGARSPKQKSAHATRGARNAKLSIGSSSITFKRPTTLDSTVTPTLTLNVVRVWEAEPPEGEAPIEWLLVTSEPIDSPEALLLTVDRYRARWTIEEFFKALKTGCSFPERQLGDYEGLINALAVFAPIACRLLALRSAAHHDGSAPATRVLEPDEIEVLRALGRRPLPTNPTTRDALLAVAALGGHIKWAPDPGWLTISRGFAELQTLTRGWRAAKLPPACDQ
jgi:hypothetical protein